jgi:hypothetical protein
MRRFLPELALVVQRIYRQLVDALDHAQLDRLLPNDHRRRTRIDQGAAQVVILFQQVPQMGAQSVS